ncbi:MAG: MerR family transcriptional regulator [Acidimicrobiia bacterium]
MASESHASIGEVLAQLHSEFPDVTISKIRFLESQGLIDPERTPSGYRKFYERDVERLRWILLQQKDNFLPLKVIKDRLTEMDARGVLPSAANANDAMDASDVIEAVDAPKVTKRTRRSKKSDPATLVHTDSPSRVEMPTLPLDDGASDDLATSPSGASFTRGELAKASGLTEQQIAELESYGLLAPLGQVGDHVLFDEEAFAIARSAAGFYRRGIEARHLRMYRSFAEREAALFQQVVLPLLKQRNPEARRVAHDEIGELAKLGRGLRAAYLRLAVAELLAE